MAPWLFGVGGPSGSVQSGFMFRSFQLGDEPPWGSGGSCGSGVFWAPEGRRWERWWPFIISSVGTMGSVGSMCSMCSVGSIGSVRGETGYGAHLCSSVPLPIGLCVSSGGPPAGKEACPLCTRAGEEEPEARRPGWEP